MLVELPCVSVKFIECEALQGITRPGASVSSQQERGKLGRDMRTKPFIEDYKHSISTAKIYKTRWKNGFKWHFFRILYAWRGES
jgi:hypothetical protein